MDKVSLQIETVLSALLWSIGLSVAVDWIPHFQSITVRALTFFNLGRNAVHIQIRLHRINESNAVIEWVVIMRAVRRHYSAKSIVKMSVQSTKDKQSTQASLLLTSESEVSTMIVTVC